MAHVARISRLRVCRAPSCGASGRRAGFVRPPSPSHQPGFSARVLLSSKGHERIGNYATLLLGLRVVSGINAILGGVALATVFPLLLFFFSFLHSRFPAHLFSAAVRVFCSKILRARQLIEFEGINRAPSR